MSINRRKAIQTVVYSYSGTLGIKWKELLIHVVTLMILTHIISSKRSQTQKGFILQDSIYRKFKEKAKLT